MKRILVTASHHKMADGLKDTLNFVSGGVQQFFRYRNRPHTHIVSGMNLPLAFQVAMEPQGEYITVERMREMVEEAKNEIKYVNDIADDGDDEDE